MDVFLKTWLDQVILVLINCSVRIVRIGIMEERVNIIILVHNILFNLDQSGNNYHLYIHDYWLVRFKY